MVTSRRAAKAIPPPADPPAQELALELEPDLDEMSDVDRIRAMLGDLDGQEIKINLYRVGRSGQRDAFLEEMDGGSFSLSEIQRAYGAGLYCVKIYGPPESGRGAPVLKANRKFEIGASARDLAPAPSTEISELKALVLELASKVNAPAPPAPAPKSLADQITELSVLAKVMRELQPPPPPPAPPAPSLIEQIKMMRELQSFTAELDTPPAAPEPSDNSLLMEGFKTVLGVMGAARRNQNQDGGAAEQNLPEPSLPPGPQQDEDDMSLILRIATNQLLKSAKNNEPIVEVADKVMSIASDEMIMELLDNENWFQAVVNFAPDASEHLAYFTLLRTEILSRYMEGDGEPGEVQKPSTDAKSAQPAAGSKNKR